MQIKNNTFNVLRSKLIKNFIKRKIGVWLNYNTHFKLFQHDSIENKVASSSLYGSQKSAMMQESCFLPKKTQKPLKIKGFCVRAQNCCTNMAPHLLANIWTRTSVFLCSLRHPVLTHLPSLRSDSRTSLRAAQTLSSAAPSGLLPANLRCH